jgi:AcrR family transcriptional regulator
MPKTQVRLSSEERREAIVKAVRAVFAEKGFHGTTTRALAEAAGVSEALLFKHFPSKEALYAAMQSACCAQQAEEGERLMALEPSTSSLVHLIHFLVSRIVLGRGPVDGVRDDTMARLMQRSMLEDGDFARLFLARLGECWIPRIEECLQAATAAGDVIDSPVLPSLRSWFAHHLAVMLLIIRLPNPPALDHGVSGETLVEQAVWFVLSGMGLKPEAIRRHYNPQALALLGG